MEKQLNPSLLISFVLSCVAIGVALKHYMALDKTIIFPFFPNVIDITLILALGIITLYKTLRELFKEENKNGD